MPSGVPRSTLRSSASSRRHPFLAPARRLPTCTARCGGGSRSARSASSLCGIAGVFDVAVSLASVCCARTPRARGAGRLGALGPSGSLGRRSSTAASMRTASLCPASPGVRGGCPASRRRSCCARAAAVSPVMFRWAPVEARRQAASTSTRFREAAATVSFAGWCRCRVSAAAVAAVSAVPAVHWGRGIVGSCSRHCCMNAARWSVAHCCSCTLAASSAAPQSRFVRRDDSRTAVATARLWPEVFASRDACCAALRAASVAADPGGSGGTPPTHASAYSAAATGPVHASLAQFLPLHAPLRRAEVVCGAPWSVALSGPTSGRRGRLHPIHPCPRHWHLRAALPRPPPCAPHPVVLLRGGLVQRRDRRCVHLRSVVPRVVSPLSLRMQRAGVLRRSSPPPLPTSCPRCPVVRSRGPGGPGRTARFP